MNKIDDGGFTSDDFTECLTALSGAPEDASARMSNRYNIILAALQIAAKAHFIRSADVDGEAFFRLCALSAGHTLTPQDVADIEKVLNDYNDEIGENSERFERARECVLGEIGGQELVDAARHADDLQSAVAVDRALKHYQEIAAKYETEASVIAARSSGGASDG